MKPILGCRYFLHKKFLLEWLFMLRSYGDGESICIYKKCSLTLVKTNRYSVQEALRNLANGNGREKSS